MEALAAAFASGVADVQVESVTERCLRNVCSVLTLILGPALQERTAEGTYWAALRALEAWSELVRGNLSGVLCDGRPS